MMEQVVQTKARRLGLAIFAVAVYAAVCVALFVAIRRLTGGHLLFSLDDPYIHLALAEQIARGHYGINAGEAASPSSSILWPFLLAPFSRLSWQPMAALGINFLAGVGSAIGFAFAVSEWFDDPPASWSRLGELCERDWPVTSGGRCVEYYATSMTPLEETRAEFRNFVATLPPGMLVTVGPSEGGSVLKAGAFAAGHGL